MKKVLVSVTLICYIAVTCGVVVNFHYCMNRLASVQLLVSESKVCGQCGMHIKKSHGCCHDEIKIVKVQDDQQKAQAVPSLQVPDVIAVAPSAFIVVPFYNINELRHGHNHSPPLITEQDTYLQNCVFRI